MSKLEVDADILLEHVRLVAYSSDDEVSDAAKDNARRTVALLTEQRETDE